MVEDLAQGPKLLQGPETRVHVAVGGGHIALPRGSKYPFFKDSDPKNRTLNGCLDQRP